LLQGLCQCLQPRSTLPCIDTCVRSTHAMDFDDLDDEVEARLAAGEQVAGLVIENHQPRQGEELPLVKRAIAKSSKVALDIFLPERARKEIPPWNGEDEKEKKTCREAAVHPWCRR